MPTLREVDQRFHALLAITDRIIDQELDHWTGPRVVYRPPTLCVGVGCRRGVELEQVRSLFETVMHEAKLASASLAAVATVSLKGDEPALRQFAEAMQVPLLSFTVEDLSRLYPLPTPSELVLAKIGLLGVAEPAAMLAAGTRKLLVTKQASDSVTLAVARRNLGTL